MEHRGFLYIKIYKLIHCYIYTSLVAQSIKNPPASTGDTGDAGSIPESGGPPGGEDSTHSSALAQRVTWREEPGGLQSLGLQESDRLSN